MSLLLEKINRISEASSRAVPSEQVHNEGRDDHFERNDSEPVEDDNANIKEMLLPIDSDVENEDPFSGSNETIILEGKNSLQINDHGENCENNKYSRRKTRKKKKQ